MMKATVPRVRLRNRVMKEKKLCTISGRFYISARGKRPGLAKTTKVRSKHIDEPKLTHWYARHNDMRLKELECN